MTDEERKAYKRRWYLENRKRILARDRERYEQKREEKIAYQARYRKENTDKVRESNARYRAAKPEKKREFQARYRAKHFSKILRQRAFYWQKAAEAYATDPEKYRARIARWRAKNPDHAKVSYQRYRTRKNAAGGSFTVEDVQRLQVIQGNMCVVCDALFDEVPMTIDHVLPVSRGGSSDPSNLQLLCDPCNKRKNAKTMVEWLT
jgi:5-methylcytosine-specific restriction endonuclease McrA